MKKINKIIYIGMAVLFMTLGCTDQFEEINKNPNRPESVSADLLLAGVIKTTATKISQEAYNGGDIVAQHTAKINFTGFDMYLWGSNTGLWNDFYGKLREISNILAIAKETENPNYEATALIMKSWMYMVLTDTWGDVPYSEATKGKTESVFKPTYDTQENIYNGILADLTNAASIIQVNGKAIGGDLLYDGDMSKWVKFANTLKIRALMRISNKRDIAAELQSIIDNQPIFESNDDNALMKFLAERPNTWPPNAGRVGGFDEHRLSLTIEKVLKDRNDPRLFKWFRPTDNPDDDPALYAGMPNGLSENNATTYNGGANNVSRLGKIMFEEPNSVDAVIMQYAELQFILAEAAQKGMISGDAKTYYENGVKASFEYWTVDMPADYLTSVGVAYDNNLETIMTQKWLGSFLVGYEAWYDFRRTGLPTFIVPGPDNVNGNKVPVRFHYPDEQQTLNKDNYDAAVAVQGVDDINTKVWWEK